MGMLLKDGGFEVYFSKIREKIEENMVAWLYCGLVSLKVASQHCPSVFHCL